MAYVAGAATGPMKPEEFAAWKADMDAKAALHYADGGRAPMPTPEQFRAWYPNSTGHKIECMGCGTPTPEELIDGKDDGTGNFNILHCRECYGPGWDPL